MSRVLYVFNLFLLEGSSSVILRLVVHKFITLNFVINLRVDVLFLNK